MKFENKYWDAWEFSKQRGNISIKHPKSALPPPPSTFVILIYTVTTGVASTIMLGPVQGHTIHVLKNMGIQWRIQSKMYLRKSFFKRNKLQTSFNFYCSVWKTTFKNIYHLSCVVGHPVFRVKRKKEDDNYFGVYWLLYNVNFGSVHFMSQADF